MPVGLGTGAWIPPSGRLRHEHIRSWSTKPDYASVNLNEPDALEVIDILFSQGVGVEAGYGTRRMQDVLWNMSISKNACAY